MNANPTEGELLHHKYEEKKAQLKDTTKVSILAKYGGEQYLEKAPKELLQGQTEEYVEFSRTGQVVKGKERAKAKSKYPEDGVSQNPPLSSFALLTCMIVYINNHTAIWGSWYDPTSGQWGFACCHSTIHLSYCTGEAGLEAARASSAQQLLAAASEPAAPAEEPAKKTVDAGSVEDRKKKAEELFSKKRIGEGELKFDEKKLAEAIQAERKRKARGEEEEWGGKRKKGGDKYEVTEEEMGKCSFVTVARLYVY